MCGMLTSKETFPKAILLDRDGVINFDSPDYILSPEQWRPIPGSLEAIAKLTKAGISVAIISNQSAVGRGMLDDTTFQNIHAKMLLSIEALGGRIDHVSYCPHAPSDGCTCRKPLPGMVLEALLALNLSNEAQHVYMIGDSLRDMQAAWAANISGILVQSGYGDATDILAKARLHDPHIQSYPNLEAAVCSILKH